MAERELFKVFANPWRLQDVGDQGQVVSLCRAKVEMWRPACVDRISLRVDLHELQAPGGDQGLVRPLLDGVVDDEQQFGDEAHVARIDEYGTLLELVAVLLQHQVSHRMHQRMAGMHQARHRGAHPIGETDVFLLEADSLVTPQNRLQAPAITAADDPVTLTDAGRNVGDLVPTRLARP